MRYSGMTLGQVEAVINKLGGPEGVDRFLAGDREVVIRRHVINLVQEPRYDDEFFALHRHQRLNNQTHWEWNAEAVQLRCLDSSGAAERSIAQELALIGKGQSLLNASVRDYLLKYPDLIPEAWRRFILCFAGTLFRRGQERFLPALDHESGSWRDTYLTTHHAAMGEMMVLTVSG